MIKPLNVYSKLLGKDGVLEIYNSTDYHKNDAQCPIDLKITYSNPNKKVINMLLLKKKKN